MEEEANQKEAMKNLCVSIGHLALANADFLFENLKVGSIDVEWHMGISRPEHGLMGRGMIW